jgi:hypothetical protein
VIAFMRDVLPDVQCVVPFALVLNVPHKLQERLQVARHMLQLYDKAVPHYDRLCEMYEAVRWEHASLRREWIAAVVVRVRSYRAAAAF